MYNALQDPAITNAMRDGYPRYTANPVCPVCGRPCEKFYKQDGEIIGCDECIEELDALE